MISGAPLHIGRFCVADYAGTTLRDHYGLRRPASIFSNAIQAIA